jgi:uncharacterized protein (TIGR03000 family)
MYSTNSTKAASFALALLLSIMGECPAQDPGNGPVRKKIEKLTETSSVWPWNIPSYRGYNELPSITALQGPWGKPEKYELHVSKLPDEYKSESKTMTIVAQVPANAVIWIDNTLMNGTDTPRKFNSAGLDPKASYVYTVCVGWAENGHAVAETQKFTVKACGIYAVYLMEAKATLETKKTVAANLGKLSRSDRKLAQQQMFCAVQEGIMLGETGVPFKTVINGLPVFLCCEACAERAQSNPEKTLAKVKELQLKHASAESK